MAIVVHRPRLGRRPRFVAGMRGMGCPGNRAMGCPPDVAGMGDPLFWTPGAIASFKDQVATEIDNIARDVTAAWTTGKMSSAARAPWKAFYDEWVKYRDSVGFLSELWGATATRLKDYQARAAQFRQQLVDQGVAVTAPPPAPPGSSGTNWTPYLKWGLVIAGGVVVVRLITAVRG